eukprot:Rhum_TRINITY_DN14795_c17_g2::Rhum_TRINITY_DN14795_c17_g2_i1::g.118356::m.118356
MLRSTLSVGEPFARDVATTGHNGGKGLLHPAWHILLRLSHVLLPCSGHLTSSVSPLMLLRAASPRGRRLGWLLRRRRRRVGLRRRLQRRKLLRDCSSVVAVDVIAVGVVVVVVVAVGGGGSGGGRGCGGGGGGGVGGAVGVVVVGAARRRGGIPAGRGDAAVEDAPCLRVMLVPERAHDTAAGRMRSGEDRLARRDGGRRKLLLLLRNQPRGLRLLHLLRGRVVHDNARRSLGRLRVLEDHPHPSALLLLLLRLLLNRRSLRLHLLLREDLVLLPALVCRLLDSLLDALVTRTVLLHRGHSLDRELLLLHAHDTTLVGHRCSRVCVRCLGLLLRLNSDQLRLHKALLRLLLLLLRLLRLVLLCLLQDLLRPLLLLQH